jgi:hypothetical protein
LCERLDDCHRELSSLLEKGSFDLNHSIHCLTCSQAFPKFARMFEQWPTNTSKRQPQSLHFSPESPQQSCNPPIKKQIHPSRMSSMSCFSLRYCLVSWAS